MLPLLRLHPFPNMRKFDSDIKQHQYPFSTAKQCSSQIAAKPAKPTHSVLSSELQSASCFPRISCMKGSKQEYLPFSEPLASG